MTPRALLIGLLWATVISVFTYFNDHIVQQTFLISNHFPIIVFGFLVVLLLGVNPILKTLRAKILNAAEVALIIAISLAVCGWPGSSFFRAFSAVVTMPPNLVKAEAGWQATHVMSYVPGASPLLGEGHVQDWPNLTKKIYSAQSDSFASPQKRIWTLLSEKGKFLVKSGATTGSLDQTERLDLLNAIDNIVADPNFYDTISFASLSATMPSDMQKMFTSSAFSDLSDLKKQWVNRRLFEITFPGIIFPAPQGKGFFLADGDISDPAYQKIMQGKEGKKNVGLSEIPWATWMPVLKLWGGLALLLSISSVCLIIIVQPQWKRELLPYPIARFVQDFAEPSQKNAFPLVAYSKLFWYGLGLLVAIHLLNGMAKWFPNLIAIQMQFDFSGLSKIIPDAFGFDQANLFLYRPRLFPAVIAFAFFLAPEISFSVGISGILYLVFFTVIRSLNISPLNVEFLDPAPASMLRFGAYLGMAGMIFFIGRHYYMRVIGGTFGLPVKKDVPASSLWASRLLLLCMVVSVILLKMNGLDWLLGSLFILLVLLLFLVMSRVNVETGTFFVQPMWAPVGVLTALFGMQAIGPTAYIILALLCTLLTLDPREIVMPFIANGMYMVTDPDKKVPPTRAILLLGTMVVVGFFLALGATLWYQHNNGLNMWDQWVTRNVPALPFNYFSQHISELSAYNELSHSLTLSNLGRLSALTPMYPMLVWGGVGLALVIGASLMRLNFAWWPLHPVIFLIWGTFPASTFAPSFLIGWLIKIAVVKMSGVKGFRTVKPFMMGAIAGELIMALAWVLVGLIFHAVTGRVPTAVYQVFPG